MCLYVFLVQCYSTINEKVPNFDSIVWATVHLAFLSPHCHSSCSTYIQSMYMYCVCSQQVFLSGWHGFSRRVGMITPFCWHRSNPWSSVPPPQHHISVQSILSDSQMCYEKPYKLSSLWISMNFKLQSQFLTQVMLHWGLPRLWHHACLWLAVQFNWSSCCSPMFHEAFLYSGTL